MFLMLLMNLKIKFHPMAIYVLYFREPKDINNHNNRMKGTFLPFFTTYLDFHDNVLKSPEMENYF